MEKFTSWLEKHLVPIATKMKRQRHLRSITNALMSTMSVMLIGGIAAILASPPIDYTTLSSYNPFMYLFKGWAWLSEMTSNIDWWIYSMTIGCLSLYVAFGIGYYLADEYKKEKIDKLVSGIVTTCVTLIINLNYDESGGLDMTYLSAQGLFATLLIGTLTAELYHQLVKKKVGYIQMPEGVPPAIANQFASLMPFLILILIAGVLKGILDACGIALPAIVIMIFSPLVKGVDSVGGILVCGFLEQLLWWFGIHNSAIGAVLDPLQANALNANIAAYAAGTAAKDLPYVNTYPFWYFQGFGYYIPLVILLIRSRSKQCKTVGKVSLIPAICNVGEPLLFGMPIVMNPTMIIPWILTRLLHLGVYGGLMAARVIARTFVYPTWTLPAILGVYLSTFDFIQVIIFLVLMVIDTLIWYPFFKAYEKECLEDEKKGMVEAVN